MKVIINIPDEDYKDIKRYGVGKGAFKVLDAIKNGIVLPKGHGRLGDLDVLETEMSNGIKAGLMIEGYENYSNINDMDDCLECVKYAPTIIDADRSEEK